jgi:hypothetical protein
MANIQTIWPLCGFVRIAANQVHSINLQGLHMNQWKNRDLGVKFCTEVETCSEKPTEEMVGPLCRIFIRLSFIIPVQSYSWYYVCTLLSTSKLPTVKMSTSKIPTAKCRTSPYLTSLTSTMLIVY